MVNLKHDLLLEERGFDEILVDQPVLPDGLHGVEFARGCPLGQVDPAKGALAQLALDCEVFEAHRCSGHGRLRRGSSAVLAGAEVVSFEQADRSTVHVDTDLGLPPAPLQHILLLNCLD